MSKIAEHITKELETANHTLTEVIPLALREIAELLEAGEIRESDHEEILSLSGLLTSLLAAKLVLEKAKEELDGP